MKVLVAEDENLVAMDICRSLERHGYSVAGPCATADAAIRLTQEARPDIVVMDIMLKGPEDGISAAAKIRDTTGIPVLFLTAHADKNTVQRARLVEPQGYLVKPFDDAQLYAALEVILYRSGKAQALRESPEEQFEESPEGEGTVPPIEPAAPGSKERFLQTLDFFSRINGYELQQFANLCEVIDLAPGEILKPDENNGQNSAFLVMSGRVAMIEPAAEGKELIIEFVPPGDLFGLISATERNRPPLVVRAARTTRLLLVPRKTFLLFLESHSEQAVYFAEYVSERFRALQSLARAIAYDDVKTRLLLTLSVLLPRFGRLNPIQKSHILDFSRQELASLTGTTVETVVRVLKQMERAGVVRLGQRNKIEILDVDALINRVDVTKEGDECR